MWWIIDVGFACLIDRKKATQAQSKCLHLDSQATNIFYRSMDSSILGEIMDFMSTHDIWIYLNNKYGMVFDDDDDDDVPKVEAHEDLEHDHNTVVGEDCSTSWSSDGDDDNATSSLDKDDNDATSDAIDDSTPYTLDGEDVGYESDDFSSSSTSSHCFMSHGDGKVSIGGVIVDCDGQILNLYINSQKL